MLSRCVPTDAPDRLKQTEMPFFCSRIGSSSLTELEPVLAVRDKLIPPRHVACLPAYTLHPPLRCSYCCLVTVFRNRCAVVSLCASPSFALLRSLQWPCMLRTSELLSVPRGIWVGDAVSCGAIGCCA